MEDFEKKPSGALANLGEAMRRHKPEILADSLQRFQRLPDDSYKFLLLKTPEGQQRMLHWTGLAISAFLGDLEPFRKDMLEIGYVRAKQGFLFSDLIKVQKFYIQSVITFLQKHPEVHDHDTRLLLEAMTRLVNIAYDTVSQTALSFISTREEIIEDKVEKLQRLYQFTQSLMSTFSQKKILEQTKEGISNLLGLRGCFLVLKNLEGADLDDECNLGEFPQRWSELADSTWVDGTEFYVDSWDGVSRDINAFPRKKAVVAPLRGLEKQYGCVFVDDMGETFSFNSEKRNLLLQLLSITALMLENSMMVQRLETHSKRLSMLTMRTLDANELERKKISEDIHDTLTQTLTGISYKLQYCQEIYQHDPEQLSNMLNELVDTVQYAIKQSRDIIFNLHPDIIDNIGLVSALENLCNSFGHKAGIAVDFSCNLHKAFPSSVTRGLYRIASEALINIRKHSVASKALVSVECRENALQMSIEDNGNIEAKELDHLVAPEDGKFGLFYMQQRVESLGGAMRIEKSSYGGLHICATVPLGDE
jgi:signal transduction histidine kinase